MYQKLSSLYEAERIHSLDWAYDVGVTVNTLRQQVLEGSKTARGTDRKRVVPKADGASLLDRLSVALQLPKNELIELARLPLAWDTYEKFKDEVIDAQGVFECTLSISHVRILASLYRDDEEEEAREELLGDALQYRWTRDDLNKAIKARRDVIKGITGKRSRPSRSVRETAPATIVSEGDVDTSTGEENTDPDIIDVEGTVVVVSEGGDTTAPDIVDENVNVPDTTAENVRVPDTTAKDGRIYIRVEDWLARISELSAAIKEDAPKYCAVIEQTHTQLVGNARTPACVEAFTKANDDVKAAKRELNNISKAITKALTWFESTA